MWTCLGLGSNVGDREAHLRNAVASLKQKGVTIVRSASIYWTEPKDVEDQPWFLNTVVEAHTHLSPLELLQQCLAVEAEAGRVRNSFKGPRPIDIDILFYDAQVIETPDLKIPHPRYSSRRFVLAPLAEIAREFKDPVTGCSVGQLLERCEDTAVVRVYPASLL